MPLNRRSVVKYPVLDTEYIPYTTLNFSEIDQQAKNLADIIEDRLKDLTDILLKYESYEVVQDEVARTLDLLRNLKENKKYFRLRVGAVTSFLPRNQPLYAFACFVVVPALMASEVHFRIPNSMRYFFSGVLALLDISKSFPNIVVSPKTRIEFLKDRSALRINPKTKENRPVTDIVIFTGIPAHSDQLRLVFDRRTLFITNGAGHNPVVVSKDANISEAVEAVITLQFYNQGQDCAAPNAILVHKAVLQNFLQILRDKINHVRVGHYKDRSCRIGPISDPKDLVRIQNFLVENGGWIDPFTPGIIRTHDAIVEPTIICKPLIKGGNFNEIFAPIIFIQEYTNDPELKYYFEDPHYIHNAMYVTLYGTSKYIIRLIQSNKEKILHNKFSLLRNTHLHAPGVERGTQPYGGYGYGASNISINGKIITMPTLPQRDIYEWIAKPILQKKSIKTEKSQLQQFTKIQKKDVEKLLRLRPFKSDERNLFTGINGTMYLDLGLTKRTSPRYIKIEECNTYKLLKEKNKEHIVALKPDDIKLISALRILLNRRSTISLDKFCSLLYTIPKEPHATKTHNMLRQHHFFRHVYQLLLGKRFGPRLAPFLWDVEKKEVDTLLDV
ncbi:MAG: aldehyde dehydrogenase family protein [Patescibacteria group bacterium]